MKKYLESPIFYMGNKYKLLKQIIPLFPKCETFIDIFGGMKTVNKIRIIDLLNKIANSEEVPKKIKYNDDLYTHVDNYCYFCEETNEILSQNIYAEFSRLNDEIEVIGEPKEELEEIELLRDDVHFLGVNLKVNEIIFKDKINELIANQNKIIRELKVNK